MRLHDTIQLLSQYTKHRTEIYEGSYFTRNVTLQGGC